MTAEEFKGWLRGFLDGKSGIDEAGIAHILEELAEVDTEVDTEMEMEMEMEMEAAPVQIPTVFPGRTYRRPLGPYKVDPYRARWIGPIATTIPTYGDGFAHN